MNLFERKKSSIGFFVILALLICFKILGVYCLYFVYSGANLRFFVGCLWIFVYCVHWWLLDHSYVHSCTLLTRKPQNFFADFKKVLAFVGTFLKVAFYLVLACVVFLTWAFSSQVLAFEVWILMSLVLFYSFCFCLVFNIQYLLLFLGKKKQQFLFFLYNSKKKQAPYNIGWAKLKLFWKQNKKITFLDSVFIGSLALVKGIIALKWPLILLIGVSLRYNVGFSLSLFYLLILLLTFIVLLPFTQKYIKKKYGLNCFRLLGWNPATTGVNGGRVVALTGVALVGVGAVDAVASLGVNHVENLVGEHQHNKNVANHKKHIDEHPDSKEAHPGSYVQKKPTSLLKRAVTSIGLLAEPKPKPAPKPHPVWGAKKT
jgi:hypothetical protein